MDQVTAFSDSGPIIYFAKLRAIEVLHSTFGPVGITPAVYRETVVAGKSGGKPDAVIIERALEAGLVQRREMDGEELRLADALESTGRSLGRGECETIACGEHLSLPVILQDRKATVLAAARGVRTLLPHSVLVHGLLGGQIAPEEFHRLLRGLAGLTNMSASYLLELQELGTVIERQRGGPGARRDD